MILMCVVYIKIKSYKCNIDSENTASPEVRKYKCFTFLQLAKKMGPRRVQIVAGGGIKKACLVNGILSLWQLVISL